MLSFGVKSLAKALIFVVKKLILDLEGMQC
jgi:hypothetical protein